MFPMKVIPEPSGRNVSPQTNPIPASLEGVNGGTYHITHLVGILHGLIGPSVAPFVLG